MTRTRAALIHLSLSVVVGSALVAVFLLIWYPDGLLGAASGDRLLYLIIGIDVIAGPLLTFVVYKQGKPGLRLDLTVIVLAQLAFLGAGAWIAISARPAYLVFASDVFVFVPANALEDADLAEARLDQFRHRPWSGPRWVYAESPATVEERNRMLDSALMGKALERYPKYYRDYDENASRVAALAHPATGLQGLTDSQLEALTRLQAGRSIEELKFLPFLGRGKDLTTVLDGSSGEVLGLLELDPWPSLQLIWQQKKEAREAQQAQATESVDSTDSGDDPQEPSSAEPDADEVPAGELKDS
jgi:hypothetical protein